MQEKADANAEEEVKSAEVKPFANFQDGVRNEGISPKVAFCLLTLASCLVS